MASDRAIREWLIADMDRADPQYQQLAAECGEQSASDLHWYGLAPYSGPQMPQACGTGNIEAWTRRVAKHSNYVQMCRACEREYTPQEKFELFQQLRAIGL